MSQIPFLGPVRNQVIGQTLGCIDRTSPSADGRPHHLLLTFDNGATLSVRAGRRGALDIQIDGPSDDIRIGRIEERLAALEQQSSQQTT